MKRKTPTMSKKMYHWLKKGIKDYEDADKFQKEFGMTPNYARLMYKKQSSKKLKSPLKNTEPKNSK
ncbi:hypothetical protein LCGC14_1509850 [marine sediment metagenome]|uniref:HTH araC/xylS-type domain-containing protein n=1 Tax=marine sediment metagenome TaxID=412755 RepID=A0A0F9J1Y4_9ZZZZ